MTAGTGGGAPVSRVGAPQPGAGGGTFEPLAAGLLTGKRMRMPMTRAAHSRGTPTSEGT